MEDVVSRSVAWRETLMRLLTGFAIIGLLLAGIGVYGVLALLRVAAHPRAGYSRRAGRVEVGHRGARAAAVGGTSRDWSGSRRRGSLTSGRLLGDLLYEVKPGDPLVIAAIAGLLLAVALLSSWLPARRAATVDPLSALREE